MAPPSQPRRGSLVPDRQVSWLRIIAAGLLPKALASVDVAHGSSVTVTGSRRIRTGFPFQLSSSHLSVVLNLWSAWPASPPPKGDRIIGCALDSLGSAPRRRAIARSRLPAPRWSERG